MRIVRLANFVAARSGGLRTALHELGRQYAAAGHEPVLVIPGPRAGEEHTTAGRVITVPGVRVPWTGGYRVIVARHRLVRLLERLEPDRLEVSDRFTLRWTGDWARARGVASMMVSHESRYGLLEPAPLADSVPASSRRRTPRSSRRWSGACRARPTPRGRHR
jgi:alpha-1,6-mannosyltransferase